MTRITVTSSKALTKTRKEELEKIFAKKYNWFKVKYVVNDEILGGLIVFDGEKVYNGSVLGKLMRIKEAIMKEME